MLRWDFKFKKIWWLWSVKACLLVADKTSSMSYSKLATSVIRWMLIITMIIWLPFQNMCLFHFLSKMKMIRNDRFHQLKNLLPLLPNLLGPLQPTFFMKTFQPWTRLKHMRYSPSVYHQERECSLLCWLSCYK